MNKIYYITYLSENISDGGMARNKAFSDKMIFFEKKRLNMYLYKNSIFQRTCKSLSFFAFFLFRRNRTIFFHQFAFPLLFPLLTNRICHYYYKRAIHFIAKRNKVIIEVNDLPHEQAIDLELPVSKSMLEFENFIFSLPNCRYIFASTEMSKFVCEKYKIHNDFSHVTINGGPKLQLCPSVIFNQKWIESKKIKYVYAGSLNKGRQIEALIDVFRKNSDNLLILIGIWGEWLSSANLPSNIIFLGEFEEAIAHYIVSLCDVGLIPYDEERFYYNLCYPTKASFYITAGIPFLSTPLSELQNVFAKSGMSYFVPFNKWNDFFKDFDKLSLVDVKRKIDIEKHKFYWDPLIGKYFDILN